MRCERPGAHYDGRRPSPTCAGVVNDRHRNRRPIRRTNHSRSATCDRQGQHQHQKFPHGHLRCVRCKVSRLGAGEGDRHHRIVEVRLATSYICNLCDSGQLQRRNTVAASIGKREDDHEMASHPFSLGVVPSSARRCGAPIRRQLSMGAEVGPCNLP